MLLPSAKLIERDLSDQEWNQIEPLLEELLPKPKGFGHPRSVELREILNGIFYVQRTGCQWEMMPHDKSALQHGVQLFPKMGAKRDLASNSRPTASPGA